MATTSINQQHRMSHRRWIVVAHVMRWASTVSALGVLALVAAEWLPEHWSQAHWLLAVMAVPLGACMFAGWMAGRRLEAMTKDSASQVNKVPRCNSHALCGIDLDAAVASIVFPGDDRDSPAPLS